MGKYFTLKELSKTNTGIPNELKGDDIRDANWFIDNILDKIRFEYGKPIHVNSGYRNSEVIEYKTDYKGWFWFGGLLLIVISYLFIKIKYGN